MKCAVAIVLALIGMVVANPVAPMGYGYGSPLLLPSAVSVSSSIINHGLTIPKVAVAPIITAPIIRTVAVRTPIVSAPISVGWGGYGGYGLSGYGGYGGYGLGGYGRLSMGGRGWH